MPSVAFPQARCRAAVARRDITPPVGIYHRMWGAATHDRATGVHRPLLATALALAPIADDNGNGNDNDNGNGQASLRRVIVAVDHCLLWHDAMQQLRERVCANAGIDPSELHIAFSHTHAAGLMDRTRAHLPGGELIGPYLDALADNIAAAVGEALATLREANVQYAAGRCDLAANRDQWDAAAGQFVCGHNPAGPTDDTVLVARITSTDGEAIATVVNYACHPTTLAWDNTLISPDYIGALRETVEAAGGGLCLYLHGASGDLGPREGFVGDVAVADRHGRQLGHAVLSALAALPPPGMRYAYAGPVVSGATIGAWRYEPLSEPQRKAAAAWRCERWTIDLAYREGLPNREATLAAREQWLAREDQANAAGDAAAARDCRAQVERLDRELVRIGQLPGGPTFPLPASMICLGDAVWVLLEGEYYHHVQRALRERFPARPIIVATVVDGWRPAYLPTRETYGRGIYQEQVAVLASGCLEAVIEAVTKRIAALDAG